MEKLNSTSIQILEATNVLFVEKGYRGVSAKKNAQAAKADEVTLFRLFGFKENLFEDTFKHFFLKPNSARLFNLDDLSSEKVLQKFGEVIHNFFVGNISLIKMTEPRYSHERS